MLLQSRQGNGERRKARCDLDETRGLERTSAGHIEHLIAHRPQHGRAYTCQDYARYITKEQFRDLMLLRRGTCSPGRDRRVVRTSTDHSQYQVPEHAD